MLESRLRSADNAYAHGAVPATASERRMPMRMSLLFALGLCAMSGLLRAQDLLPEVTVTDKGMTERHGSYVISGDFKVDAWMSAVIYPTEALRAGDVLSVQPLRLADDEYLVLQECVSADCAQAQIIRVWGAFGTTTRSHDANRIIVRHEGKYFIWMSRIKAGLAPPDSGTWFTEFEKFGAPLTLTPMGTLAAYSGPQIDAAKAAGPVVVKASAREEASFVVTFTTGSVARFKRMHAEN